MEKLWNVGPFNLDTLVDAVADRRYMIGAILNYSKLYDIPIESVDPQMITLSSAGVRGWAEAKVSFPEHEIQFPEQTPTADLSRPGTGLPPAAEDVRHGERKPKNTHKDPPDTKPQISPEEVAALVANCEDEIDAREKMLRRHEEIWKQGQTPIGIISAGKWVSVVHEQWVEVRDSRREARRERARARGINCFLSGAAGNGSGGPLCGAWQAEDRGWSRVRVIMDSGAAESVCPRSMAPQFTVVDSAASKAGVYYTSANGGKNINLGEQHVPVCLANGCRTIAKFQVAEVSRPLMSVAKLCELGNRVIFGAAGGVILNLASGQMTHFQKEDGVYTFDMWVPPLAESPFARP